MTGVAHEFMEFDNVQRIPKNVSEFIVNYYIENHQVLLHNTAGRCMQANRERMLLYNRLISGIEHEFGLLLNMRKVKNHFEHYKSRVLEKGKALNYGQPPEKRFRTQSGRVPHKPNKRVLKNGHLKPMDEMEMKVWTYFNRSSLANESSAEVTHMASTSGCRCRSKDTSVVKEDDVCSSSSLSLEQPEVGEAVVVGDGRRESLEEPYAREMSSTSSSRIRVSDEENRGDMIKEERGECPSTSYSTSRPDFDVFDCVPELTNGYSETSNHTQQELINEHYKLLSEQRNFYNSMLHQQMEMQHMMKQITDTQSKMADLIKCLHEDLHKCKGEACRHSREEEHRIHSPKREPNS